MSSSNSFSSAYSNPELELPYEMEGEREEIASNFEVEVDDEGDQVDPNIDMESGDCMEAYFDEPIANEIWLAEYERKREEENMRLEELELRWTGRKPVDSW